MTSVINKRQQARNERALQDLIRNVPGNGVCADCQTRNPGWASWNLSCFLCQRCAQIHRKLGTHISKVKSLSMDTWTSDQVEAMKKSGNVASNRIFNPRNVKPIIPLDPDEIDTEMEKFIRAKYQRRTLGASISRDASTHHTGSTSSTDDHPPPVPEKNTPPFASALMAPSFSNGLPRTERPLPPLNEANGRVLPEINTTAQRGSNEEKLATLRSMGFHNEKRNLSLLKGLNGNVERTVEALVRLGDGDDPTAVSVGTNVPLPPRAHSIATPTYDMRPSIGGIPDRAQVQTSQATTSATSNIQNHDYSSNKSYNPFDPPLVPQTSAKSTPPLETSFQNMSLSQQALSPNSTGTWQIQNQHNPFLNTFTPPVSPSPYQSIGTPPQSTFPPHYVPHRGYTDPTASTNPFLRSSRSQTFAPSNLANSVQDASEFPVSSYSTQSTPLVPSAPSWRSVSQPLLPQYQQPFPHGQTATTNPISQSPFQQVPFAQPPFQQPVFSDSPLPSPGLQAAPSYWGQQATSGFPIQAQQSQHQQLPNQTLQQFHAQSCPPQNVQFQTQPQAPPAQAQPQYQTPRFDKSSILALYNQPQVSQGPVQSQPNALLSGTASEPPSKLSQLASATSNGTGVAHTNPFAKLLGSSETPGGLGHIREESKDFSALMNRNTGRHSPDAFAGLSARYR